MKDTDEQSNPSTGSVQILAWGVMPGDNLPLWRCSSKRQAEAVVVWLREQRPTTTPQAVPLVDGRNSPTLTDAEREAMAFAVDAYENCFCQRVGLDNNGPDDCGRVAATLRGLLERLK